MADKYLNSEPGIVGRVLGPNPGSTPADDSDLHGPGMNPHSGPTGSPPYDLARPSNFGQGNDAINLDAADVAKATPYDVAAPYFRNPPASAGNPYSQSAPTGMHEAGDQGAAAGIAGGLDNLYAHTFANYANSAASAEQLTPDSAQNRPYNLDTGLDDQTVPPTQRK